MTLPWARVRGNLAHPPFLGALIFFAVLWLLDFPKPSYDDLFQCGAGLNMAAGGDFSNPLLDRQGFPSHYFFVYPPLNSYTLAAWLRVFGINSASVTAYPMVMCVIVAIATMVLLRRHGASPWLEWCVPLGVSFVIMPLSVRPEPLAVALCMSGFALADYALKRPGAGVQFTAFLLMFCGVSAGPRTAVFVFALAACAAYRAWKNAATAAERWSLAGACGAAAVVTGLLSLAMIHFQLREFVQTFQYHANGRLFKHKLQAISIYLFKYLGYLQLTLILMPLGLLIYVLRKPKDDLCVMSFFLISAVPVVVWLGALGSATAWWAILVMLLLAVSAGKRLPKSRVLALQAAIALVLLVVNRKTLAQCAGTLTGKIDSERGTQYAAALNLKPTAEHPLLLDGWVARYVYDYRLPRGALDLEWGTPFPGAFPGSYRLPEKCGPQIRAGDIYVVGNYLLGCLKEKTYLDLPEPESWPVLGLKKLAFERHPRSVYVIPAESCKDVRVDAMTGSPGDY